MPMPELSIVVPFSGDAERAEDTLRSLSPGVQRHVGASDYEIFAVEGPSSDELGQSRASAHGGVRYVRHEAPVDLATAAKLGLALSEAHFLGIVLGTPLLTPRTVEHALFATRADADPIAVVPSYRVFASRQDGFGPTPDELPKGVPLPVDWEQDPYDLFDFARFSPMVERGYLSPFTDVSCVFAKRESVAAALEGDIGQGSLFGRLLQRPSSRLVILASEGALSRADGTPLPAPTPKRAVPTREPLVLGAFSWQVQRFAIEAAEWGEMFHALAAESGRPTYAMDP
jgi:hypothetical protein